MNAQQRKYIKSELESIRDTKICKVSVKHKASDNLEKIIKAIKKGDIKQLSMGMSSSTELSRYIKPEYLTKGVKYGFLEFNKSSQIICKDGRFITFLCEISSNALSTLHSYNNLLTLIRNNATNVHIIDDIITKDKEIISKINEEFKKVERKVMLSDSEEMITAIETFEAMEF